MDINSIWLAIISEQNSVIFARGCLSREKAEAFIVEYLKENWEFTGSDFKQACCWVGAKDLRLDLQVFAMARDDFSDIPCSGGLIISPPPREKDAFRVIYIIDIYALDVRTAAHAAYQLMIDPESLRPVLNVIDILGKVYVIDLNNNS